MLLAEYPPSVSPDAKVPELRPLTTYLFDRADSGDSAFTQLDYSVERTGVEHTIGWNELAMRVRATAAAVAAVTSRGQRVAVVANQNLNYVIGFLAALHAGTIAVPLFAPDASQHADRLVNALADCSPEVWLTGQDTVDTLHGFAGNTPVPMPKQIMAVDGIDPATGDGFQAPSLDLAEPAYLQYTSGSTRAPAGAVITHRAVVSNTWQGGTGFHVDESWTCAGWIPFFHDMGLIQLLTIPVLFGSRSVFMSPFDFIMRPVRWLRQMSDYPNVFAAAPNFAFEYATRKVREADRKGLDLSGVRAVINGSEPVRATTIAAFQEAFGPYGFPAEAHRPSYGLAEATVFVTNTREEGPTITSFDRSDLADDRAVIAQHGSQGALELVAAGRPHAQLVRIVDPRTRTVRPDDTVGEVWIHGPNVADGYWQQSGGEIILRSEETFGVTLVDPPRGTPAARWLRTGDLGMVHDGLLYITGRIKDLIIVDGKNHYPQDIEVTVQDAHPAIRSDHVAAFAITTSSGEEGVAVVAEYRARSDDDNADAVNKAVHRAVSAKHDVKLRGFELVRPGSVLRTSSGKIARAATKEKFWSSSGTGSGGA